jgi:hypothetical protein
LSEIAAQTGKPPPALASRPERYPDLELYYKSFWELSAYRTSAGFGPNPLSLQDIASYCSLNGIHDTALFVRFVHACDEAYLKYAMSKQSNG